MSGSNDIKILGIETSCDDTAIGVVNSKKDILSNVVINQNSNLNNYGGVVPEIAARDHLSNLDHAINRALEESKLNLKEIMGGAEKIPDGESHILDIHLLSFSRFKTIR